MKRRKRSAEGKQDMQRREIQVGFLSSGLERAERKDWKTPAGAILGPHLCPSSLLELIDPVAYVLLAGLQSFSKG